MLWSLRPIGTASAGCPVTFQGTSPAEVFAARSDRIAPRVGQSSMSGADASHNGVSTTSALSNTRLIESATYASRLSARRSDLSGNARPRRATERVRASNPPRCGSDATSLWTPLTSRMVEFHSDASP